MSFLRLGFDSRVAEIEKYFSFLEHIESDYRVLSNYAQTAAFNIDDELCKVLKANGFLLLYNLIESTILNSIIGIFDAVKLENLCYKEVSEQIKKYWFKNTFKYDDKIEKTTLYQKVYKIMEDILQSTPIEIIKTKIEHAGSLDAKKIREILMDLGVQFTTPHYSIDTHGKVFSKIKTNRNDLAHGKKSFSEIGKDVTFNGVIRINEDDKEVIEEMGLSHFKKFTIEHLEVFIDAVDAYISSKAFKSHAA